MVSNPTLSEEQMKEDMVLLNGEILTKGSFKCEITSVLEENKIGIKHQDIFITGVLKTKYYVKELNELESIRYYVNDIFVKKESYDSLNDVITYEFEAMYFKPKFQDTEYERISRE